MSLFLIISAAVVVALAVAWGTGAVGRGRVLTEQEASVALSELLSEVAPEPPLVVPASAFTEAPPAGGASVPMPHDTPYADVKAHRPSWTDGAIPAGIATVVGLQEWLTPDSAALAALEHVTGQEVNNALDFHAIVAGKALSGDGYHFLTDGSMSNWMGHVGEQQIREQVESWAGEGAVTMPDSASFEGADATIFGQDFQVKFYDDFNDIVNQHGDALIVNEDALNIPDDALRIDFSEPFDPAVLEGHDVIVAEGLTQAGAIDSWESAAGVWAGGLDAGDMAGEVFDAAIPGLGAAVAVAISGYRRRKALGDKTLRAEASKRIARDSGERVAAVTTAGLIGGGIGLGIDILTLGATAGLGTALGGIIGARIGGRQAARVANERDAERIRKAQKKVITSTAAYGLAVEQAQIEAATSWQQILDQGEQAASALAERLAMESGWIATAARADLDTALSLDAESTEDILRQSQLAARDLRQAGWSLPALRERQAWLTRTARLSPESTTTEVLLVAVAAPGGRDRIRLWLQAMNQRRQVIVAAADVAMRSLFRSALEARRGMRQHLVDSRGELDQRVSDSLAKPIRAVEKASEHLHRELVLAGKAT